jgi:uncharacterized membrane protein
MGSPYPELAHPPDAASARLGQIAVLLLAAAFTIFFCLYLFATHDAYLTHAEDMGIMDQALWNTTHGAPLHQTICDIVGDNNCLGDVSRFAIHFEPILLPLALLYRFVPSPKTLQLLQVVIVASGALPAYWIASRRLQSSVAGVVFAAVYLLFPALQAAVTFDFHAVTLSAAFLMFALYFMLARNDAGLIIACLLALATKEEIVVDVALIGGSVMLLQRRWRLGAGLVVLSAGWLVLELAVMHILSPVGHTPLAGRYAGLGGSPAQVARFLLTHPVAVVQNYLLEPNHLYYLRTLLAPASYLPLLSPLTLVIAVPAMAINLLSGDPAMYSGLYQYNADIVPVLVLAAIESVALLMTLARVVAARAAPPVEGLLWRRPRSGAQLAAALKSGRVARVMMAGLLALTALMSLRAQRLHGDSPLAQGFTWPQVTQHTLLANSLIQLIPPDASVSAQSDLVPHLSHRRQMYLFPYGEHEAQYVFLDVTGNTYPQGDPSAYVSGVQALLASGQFGLVAARDGYLLLKRLPPNSGTSASALTLPPEFYSFTEVTATQVPHPLAVTYGSSLQLVGYAISPSTRVYLNNPYVTVTTYWRVVGPLQGNLHPELVLTSPNGSQMFNSQFAATQWLPTANWQPGVIYAVRSWPQLMDGDEVGNLRLGAWVVDPNNQSSYALPITADSQNGGSTDSLLLDHGATAVFATLHISG